MSEQVGPVEDARRATVAAFTRAFGQIQLAGVTESAIAEMERAAMQHKVAVERYLALLPPGSKERVVPLAECVTLCVARARLTVNRWASSRGDELAAVAMSAIDDMGNAMSRHLGELSGELRKVTAIEYSREVDELVRFELSARHADHWMEAAERWTSGI